MPAVITESAHSTVQTIRPLSDNRWDKFVSSCAQSSVFHTRGWLEALYRTYRYQPIALTTYDSSSEIRNAILFCFIDNWLRGKRLVSLPFSDHCDPLIIDTAELSMFFAAIRQELLHQKLNYVEFRPKHPLNIDMQLPTSAYSYCLHQLDLRPSLETLFSKFHKDSTQRKIRRAEREGLRDEEGRSDFHLTAFYRLLLLTRKRHQVPPQPKRWFENLAECMGDALKIRVALKNGEPAAAILTLRHKDVLFYKYACSDARFHSTGAMHFLIWRAIEEAKQEGLTVLDFGRSEWNNEGLITFKDRWGSARSSLAYSRCGISGRRFEFQRVDRWVDRTAKHVVAWLPESVFRAIGEMFYKQIG